MCYGRSNAVAHLISKITVKIFLLCIGGLLTISIYFSWVHYHHTLEHAEQAEMQHIQGIVHTFALQAESNTPHSATQEPQEHDPYRHLRQGLANQLWNTNRVNGLGQGLGLVLIHTGHGQAEVITHHGAWYYESAPIEVQQLIDENPATGYSKTIHRNGSHKVLYAYPVSLPYSAAYRGFVYAYEDISTQMQAAKSAFLRQLGTASLVVIILSLLLRRWLQKILSHEALSKRKLQEYAQLAESRNKQLEMLSFVLSKSDNLILLTDGNGKIEWLNQSYDRKNNYSREELSNFVGRELAEVSNYPRIADVIASAVRTRQKQVYEAKSYDQQGQEFWASTTVTPILSGNGEVERLLFIDADITALKKAESEAVKLANFAAENDKPLIRIQFDGTVLFANEPGKAVLKTWGTEVGKVLQRPNALKVLSEVKLSGKENKMHVECNKRIYSLRFSPVVQKDYVNVYGDDITEVKIAERESLAKVHRLEAYNIHITDSINYASRIQQSILPGEDHLRRYFKDSFVLSKPRDIVSGDFFWLREIAGSDCILVAMADCTGHGVPGAMMSIVGHSLLNDIVDTHGEIDPARILELLNTEIIKTLRQKSDAQGWDGMDVCLVKLDQRTRSITYAGAYQPLYWMNGKLHVIKGDRQPIGGLQHMPDRRFSNTTFTVHSGDSIYMVTDGFTDQFGGPENKKFLSRRLEELIAQHHRYSMQAQSHLYHTAWENWKGHTEQVDDASMIGIKFT